MGLLEELAALEHEQWAGWMKYLFSKSYENVCGTVTIPKSLVKRWKRQMNTDYKDLIRGEQTSDKVEAEKAIAIMKKYMG